MNAQQYFDIGLFGGVSVYHPDYVNPSFKAPRPAYGGTIKYNLNSRYAWRASFTSGLMVFPDTLIVDKYEPLNINSQIYDVAAQMEFNFQPFKGDKNTKNHSVYVAFGIGYAGTRITNGEEQNYYSQITIPFNVGWKYSLNKRIGLSVEWNVRKMLNNKMGDPHILDNKYQKHWYSFAGVGISYKFGGSDLGRIIWHI